MEGGGDAGALRGLGGAAGEEGEEGGEFHEGPAGGAGHGDSLASYMICGMKRILYVDGFNFYYGVKEYWKAHKLAGLAWCDFRALVERHFEKTAGLQVKYFSAAVKENTPQRYEGEHERYANWMRAVGTMADTQVIQGFHKREGERSRDEKQTDVNIAVEMVMDANGHPETRPEHMYLLSGDFDLMPAVYAVGERVGIGVTVLLPTRVPAADWKSGYERTRRALREVHGAGKGRRDPAVVELSEEMLASSLLRYELRDEQGKFGCPDYWRLSGEYLAGKCGRAEWRPD